MWHSNFEVYFLAAMVVFYTMIFLQSISNKEIRNLHIMILYDKSRLARQLDFL